ncbi:MAG: endonuclease [Patescibacteria group bacterium]
MKNEKIIKALAELEKMKLPAQVQWKFWCKKNKTAQDRQEIMIGAILAQNTSWRNVELAIQKLRKAKMLTLNKYLNLPAGDNSLLQEIIKPAGFFRSKSQYLQNLAKFVKTKGSLNKLKQLDLPELRRALLSVKGIGKETADSILNYALDKPIFVIDEYTRRFCQKFKIINKKDYDSLQKLFMNNLPIDYRIYQKVHAGIVCFFKK